MYYDILYKLKTAQSDIELDANKMSVAFTITYTYIMYHSSWNLIRPPLLKVRYYRSVVRNSGYPRSTGTADLFRLRQFNKHLEGLAWMRYPSVLIIVCVRRIDHQLWIVGAIFRAIFHHKLHEKKNVRRSPCRFNEIVPRTSL